MEIDYNLILKDIKHLKDVVYYEPLEEDEIIKIEKEWNLEIRPIVREFLLQFGFTQDVVKKLKLDKEEIEEDLAFLRKNQLFEFFPIKTKIKKDTDIIWAIKSNQNFRDSIYEIKVDSNDGVKSIIEKKKSFSGIIRKSIKNMNIESRCKNVDKIRLIEFKVSSSKSKLLENLAGTKIKQITDWSNKYYPVNHFGDQIARFEMFESLDIYIEKDESELHYTFEIEEPILTKKDDSLIDETIRIMRVNNIEFEKITYDIIEVQ